MKKTMNRFLRIALIVVGIFVVSSLTTLILARYHVGEGMNILVSSVISGGVVAGLIFPVLLWLVLKAPALDQYSGYALEEIDLNEDELAEAVANWVYADRRKRVEDDLRFLEDDEGNVTCRVTVRKD